METLTLSLQITLIGMGLVFASLILLWGVMEMLVRVTQDRQPNTLETVPAEDELLHKQQAAVIAVALALAELESGPREFPLPPTALVSAWQAVMRTDMLKKRGAVR